MLLHRFYTFRCRRHSAESEAVDYCLCRYATVRDLLHPTSDTDVCGRWRRISHVMTTRSHEIRVSFIGSLVEDRLPNFLLQYQGDRYRVFLHFYVSSTKTDSKVFCHRSISGELGES